MQSSIYNEQEKAFTSILFFGPWKVTACAWGEGSGSSYFGQTNLRLPFTPDYSKSKRTSRSAKKVLLFSDCEAPAFLHFWNLGPCSEVTKKLRLSKFKDVREF